jgi:hypothetical protein
MFMPPSPATFNVTVPTSKLPPRFNEANFHLWHYKGADLLVRLNFDGPVVTSKLGEPKVVISFEEIDEEWPDVTPDHAVFLATVFD